ncbi:MAG: bifunctional 2-polyprenyl-6-hydroxyphenol methylase/3-demethylubiquinol 3-O-methyltransferase UbiG [Hyphomicrobiaceae bacterium]|nr:bifunctional 2-polyprenyl-6-hydroxyphenol methylase/3-demethylubiquinol 3-O-methyltransferase UbiG [Hyphomicrobiaceae bacterium]
MLRKDILKPFSLDHTREEEFAKFEQLAEEWWRPDGAFKVVHQFNRARVEYLTELLPRAFALAPTPDRPLSGLRIVDVGCGAGLAAEPLAHAGAEVVGIDPVARNIEIARWHMKETGADIDYRNMLPEEFAKTGKQFDVVLSLEVVEHVADVSLFLTSCAQLVAPGGLLVLATLNRTLKSFVFAIVGAEYVLRLLPRGTHDWRKFLSPDEISRQLEPNGMQEFEKTGMSFNPLRRTFRCSSDVSVNYVQVFRRPASPDSPQSRS